MPWAILDTNVYIGHWEAGLFDDTLVQLKQRFVIRQSAVVLSELRRGARTRSARRLVESLCRLATVIWEPTSQDWWMAGKLIQEIGDARHWNASKRREFQNDALIGLTARRYGAVVATSNAADFGLLAGQLEIPIFPVKP